MWSTQTCAPIGIPLEAHVDAVNCISFSPCGRQAVTGSRDKTLKLWDTMTFAQIGGPFNGHSDWVWSGSFSSDGLHHIFHRTVSINIAVVWKYATYMNVSHVFADEGGASVDERVACSHYASRSFPLEL